MNTQEVRDALTVLERSMIGSDVPDVEVDREALRTVLSYARFRAGVALSDFDPSAEYETGERVLIADDLLGNAPDYVGKIGIISKFSGSSDQYPYSYYVTFDDNESATCWSREELRKVDQ